MSKGLYADVLDTIREKGVISEVAGVANYLSRQVTGTITEIDKILVRLETQKKATIERANGVITEVRYIRRDAPSPLDMPSTWSAESKYATGADGTRYTSVLRADQVTAVEVRKQCFTMPTPQSGSRLSTAEFAEVLSFSLRILQWEANKAGLGEAPIALLTSRVKGMTKTAATRVTSHLKAMGYYKPRMAGFQKSGYTVTLKKTKITAEMVEEVRKTMKPERALQATADTADEPAVMPAATLLPSPEVAIEMMAAYIEQLEAEVEALRLSNDTANGLVRQQHERIEELEHQLATRPSVRYSNRVSGVLANIAAVNESGAHA